jgi:uncharacterized protein YkwD
MNPRKLWIAPTAVLAILVGCQGGDEAESLDSPSIAFSSSIGYAGSVDHPVLATTEDAVALGFETELERLVNEYRIGLLLDGVRVLPELKDMARAHAIHMATHDPSFFGHRNPEGDLPGDRAVTALIDFEAIGENLAAGQTAAEAVFRSWLESPAHRANLEDPRWTHMGAGHAYLPDSPYGTYWTVDFIERR